MCLLLYFSLASYSLSVPAQRLPIHLIAIRSFFFHPLPRKLNGCVSTLFLCMYSASWLSRGNLCKNSRVCIRNCIQIMLFLHCVVVIATRSMLVRANLRFLFKLGILITKKNFNSKTKMQLIFSSDCFISPSTDSKQSCQLHLSENDFLQLIIEKTLFL